MLCDCTDAPAHQPLPLHRDRLGGHQGLFLVQLQGVAAKSHSFLTGPSQVMRHTQMWRAFPMATHAKAVSDSFLLGRTIVKIDYQGYQIQRSGN